MNIWLAITAKHKRLSRPIILRLLKMMKRKRKIMLTRERK